MDNQTTDKQLLDEIFSALSARVKGDPYSDDGSYAAAIRELPPGLRAMAATHHLDVSLSLDDIGWHFLNFGEPGLVAETESGLQLLGLASLTEWFAEAAKIMAPLRSEISAPEQYSDCLDRHGQAERIDELTRKAQDLAAGCSQEVSGSAIYQAWVAYARRYPQEVFGG